MGLAYSLQDAHAKDHCERVEANPGMKYEDGAVELPFNLGPTPKDQDLLSIVPMVIPDFSVKTSASGEQAEFKGFEDDRKKGEGRERGLICLLANFRSPALCPPHMPVTQRYRNSRAEEIFKLRLGLACLELPGAVVGRFASSRRISSALGAGHMPARVNWS
jgi:hypothetical protein